MVAMYFNLGRSHTAGRCYFSALHQKSLIRHETVCACKKKPDPSIKVRRRKVSVLLCWYTQTRLTRFLHASINHSEIGEVRRRACLQSRFESKPESEQ